MENELSSNSTGNSGKAMGVVSGSVYTTMQTQIAIGTGMTKKVDQDSLSSHRNSHR